MYEVITMPEDLCSAESTHPELIDKAKQGMPDDLDLDDASYLVKVLADPTRMRMIAALLASELCVCDLADLTGMSQSAISHQLRVLRQSRVVKYRREGKNTFYSLDDEHIRLLVATAIAHVREMRPHGQEERG